MKKQLTETQINELHELFASDLQVDEIVEKFYSDNSEDFKITQVASVVRGFGKAHDYIIPVKVRRANALQDLTDGHDWMHPLKLDEVTHLVDHLTEKHGVTERFLRDTMKDLASEHGWELPKKSRARKMGGWRLAMADALGANPEMELEDLIPIVEPHVKSTDVAIDYINDFAWMIKRALDTNAKC